MIVIVHSLILGRRFLYEKIWIILLLVLIGAGVLLFFLWGKYDSAMPKISANDISSMKVSSFAEKQTKEVLKDEYKVALKLLGKIKTGEIVTVDTQAVNSLGIIEIIKKNDARSVIVIADHYIQIDEVWYERKESLPDSFDEWYLQLKGNPQTWLRDE